MITTYTEITPLEGLKLLVENDGKPVEGLAFKDDRGWVSGRLSGVNLLSTYPFWTKSNWKHCAKVTELDPCKAPEGCPELEPWMAYVGDQQLEKDCPDGYYTTGPEAMGWNPCGGRFNRVFRAIDVRTKWAQEHFPEHCKQRAYRGDLLACRNAATDFLRGGGLVVELKHLLGSARNMIEYKGDYDELRKQIETYVKPDPFDVWFHGISQHRMDRDESIALIREAYELGQRNPNKS